MPANKHASAYLNAAYERMVAAVQAMEPPAFSMEPVAGQFEDAADHLKAKWVSAIDEYIAAIAREADSNARSHIGTKDRQTILSDALHDSSLPGELRNEASDLEEYDPAADRADHDFKLARETA